MRIVSAVLSSRTYALGLLLAVAACGGSEGGGPADLPGGWQPAATIGDPGDGGFAPALATAPNGDIYLVFYGEDNAWAGRWVASTATWDPLVSLDGGSGYAANPSIAVNDDGDAVVTWWSRHQEAIHVASFDAGAGWPSGWATADAVPVVADATLQPYVIALAEDGSAALTWVQIANGSERTSWAAIKEAGQAWTTPVRISGAAGYAVSPSIAISDLGGELRVVATWEGEGTHTFGDVMTYSKASHSGIWAPAVQLDQETDRRALPRGVAVDGSGNATAMYEARDEFGNDDEVFVVRYTGSWSAPTSVAMSPPGHTEPDLAIDPAGDVAVAFDVCGGSTCMLKVRWFTGGAWQAPVDVAPIQTLPVLAISDGHALLAWSQRDPNGGWESMWGASFDGTAWSAPQRLETEEMADHGTAYDVTLRHGHAGLAAWVRTVGESPHLMRSISGALFGDP